MKLKKLVSIGVVAAMVASMAVGCGNSSKTEDTKIETKLGAGIYRRVRGIL